MGLINWIFDFYQQYRIDQLGDQAARIPYPVSTGSGTVDVQKLEQTLGELALALKTVQRIAVEKGLCTQEELYNKLKVIDQEDGQADGRAPLR